jgi:hypothetical protein
MFLSCLIHPLPFLGYEQLIPYNNALDIAVEALGERYLGLPTSVGKVSDGVFEYIPSQMRGFICCWSENLLNICCWSGLLSCAEEKF